LPQVQIRSSWLSHSREMRDIRNNPTRAVRKISWRLVEGFYRRKSETNYGRRFVLKSRRQTECLPNSCLRNTETSRPDPQFTRSPVDPKRATLAVIPLH
jgi:hypothetical protein